MNVDPCLSTYLSTSYCQYHYFDSDCYVVLDSAASMNWKCYAEKLSPLRLLARRSLLSVALSPTHRDKVEPVMIGSFYLSKISIEEVTSSLRVIKEIRRLMGREWLRASKDYIIV